MTFLTDKKATNVFHVSFCISMEVSSALDKNTEMKPDPTGTCESSWASRDNDPTCALGWHEMQKNTLGKRGEQAYAHAH